jgi:hypothetical protein
VCGLSNAQALYDSVSRSPALQTAKIILHQAARMVWLADQVDRVARGRPALQILFYIIAAEAVAKLAAGYAGESESKKYVKRFFDEHVMRDQRKAIRRALTALKQQPLPRTPRTGRPDQTIADCLYTIRCDVAHRGEYFNVLSIDDAGIRIICAVILAGAVTAARNVIRQEEQ